MRTTLSIVAPAGLALILTLSANASVTIATSRRSVATNPCLHGFEGGEQRVLDNARALAAETDSVTVGFRSALGLAWWPLDSVASTTDSTVCAHLDSLIARWQLTSEADSLGATRDSVWPGISVARVNPHKYLAKPPLVQNDLRWYFLVDSLTGNVHFYRANM